MDGNGRWAVQRRRPRSFGHRAGAKAVRMMVEHCLRRGVEILTLFAFSSENWGRPTPEVNALMELFIKSLDREVPQLHENGVRLRFIGDLHAFPETLQQRMTKSAEHTVGNAKLTLVIAVNYGGRWDIAQAAQHAASKLAVAEINQDSLAAFLCLSDLPEPDLLIRTGGEQRISNFLLWQLAYCELYFTDTLWPDFDADCLQLALEEFARRERRFGKTSTQLSKPSRRIG